MNTAEKKSQAQGIRILPLGELMHHQYENLEQALHKTAGRGAQIVVDLSRTEFISSSGIGFLLRLKALAEAEGGSVLLKSPSPVLRRIFTKLQLHTVFEIAPERRGAETQRTRPDSRRTVPGHACECIPFFANSHIHSRPKSLSLSA